MRAPSAVAAVPNRIKVISDQACASPASAGPAADAYNTALNFPNLFRRIFAEGAFAAAFVPAYAKTLKTQGQAVADQVATDALAAVAAVTVVLTIIAQLTMPWLMTVINIGFLDDPARFKLAVILTQITMPYLPCMAVAARTLRRYTGRLPASLSPCAAWPAR